MRSAAKLLGIGPKNCSKLPSSVSYFLPRVCSFLAGTPLRNLILLIVLTELVELNLGQLIAWL